MIAVARTWCRVLLLLLVLAACAGPAGERSAPAAESAVTSAAPTSSLRIGLTEWSIETGGATLTAGEVQVTVTNTGATGHDVVIHGEQGTWRTPVLRPGERHEMVITTTGGEQLDLVCAVTGHDSAGMRGRLAVADEGAT